MNLTTRNRKASGQLIAGLILIAIGGVILFAEPFYDLRLDKLWPLILVALGARKLFGSHSSRQLRGGLVLIVIGCWGLISTFDLWGFSFSNSWPLLLIGMGAVFLAVPKPQGSLGGMWMVAVGGTFLVIERGWVGASMEDLLPVFLIFAGASILWKAMRRGRAT